MTRWAGGFLPGVRLVRRSGRPLHWQIAAQAAHAIQQGALRSGERLPSTRALAQQLNVSRNTVITAYDELAARDLIVGRRGGGMYVSATGRGHARNLSALVPVRRVEIGDADGNRFYLRF